MKPAEYTFADFHVQLQALLPGGVQGQVGKPPYFSGYSYGTLYDWDAYFESIVWLYAGFPADYVRHAVQLFLARQQENGLIHRTVPPGGETSYVKHQVHAKPFLAQTTLLIRSAEGAGGLDWLGDDHGYERLKKYLDYWLFALDVRGAGLSIWQEAEHTGMDNHYERAGDWHGVNRFCEGVDLNSYLVRECQAFAIIAAELGYTDDAATYTKLGEQRSAAIQEWLWDDEAGLFLDYHALEERSIPVRYVGTFLPLWSATATDEQAGRLVHEHLLNEREFARPWPIPGLAASEPGYVEGHLEGHSTGCCSWRAHTWVPTNYMVFQGLRRYDFHEEAGTLAERTWHLFQRGRFCEYYTSEGGIGTGLKPFRGWSCLAPFMPLEYETGCDPTALNPNNHAQTVVRACIRSLRKSKKEMNSHEVPRHTVT